jgi:hypothetical protein
MPSETQRTISPEAENGLARERTPSGNGGGSRIIGFSRILRPYKRWFLRALRVSGVAGRRSLPVRIIQSRKGDARYRIARENE